MYTVIEHTPLYVLGIISLITTIYLTYLFRTKVKGILIFKVVTILLFLSVSLMAVLVEIFPDEVFFMFKHIFPLLGTMFILLGIYNKILLRRDKENTKW